MLLLLVLLVLFFFVFFCYSFLNIVLWIICQLLLSRLFHWIQCFLLNFQKQWQDWPRILFFFFIFLHTFNSSRSLEQIPLTLTPEDVDISDGDEDKEKKSGRRKIKIEYIDDKSRRHITFSKRKAGIMKKVWNNFIFRYSILNIFYYDGKNKRNKKKVVTTSSALNLEKERQ